MNLRSRILLLLASLLAWPVHADESVLEQQAAHFWRTVTAEATERETLLKRYFSASVRERNGDERLLEMLTMLVDDLGPELTDLGPPTVVAAEKGKELHYSLPDGRRLALMLTLTETDPPQIDRFGVRPMPPEVSAVAIEQLPAAIGDRLKSDTEAGRFSGAVLVARGDELLYAQAHGLADRQSGRANTLDTPINLGSMNKMFTAIAIGQLQAAGKLDWNDPVGIHLPDFPNAKIRDQVTIHQLLTHSSGVGSYWNEAYAARKHEIDSQQEFLDTFVDEPLLFDPGQGNEYSNGGPVILGLIIEALSGMSYYDYVHKQIYQPAGMKHAAHYLSNDSEPVFALGYMQTDDGSWQDNSEDLGLRGSAAGGGYASARDLFGFARALAGERLLSRPQLETLWKARLQPGPEFGYGYLFGSGMLSGKRWIGHNGGAPGISAEFRYYPDDNLVVIVLANQDRAAMAIGEWLNALVAVSLGSGSH